MVKGKQKTPKTTTSFEKASLAPLAKGERAFDNMTTTSVGTLAEVESESFKGCENEGIDSTNQRSEATETSDGQQHGILYAQSLCETCQKLLKERRIGGYFFLFKYRPSSLDLETCGVCRVIYLIVQKTECDRLDEEWYMELRPLNNELVLGPWIDRTKPWSELRISLSPSLQCPWEIFMHSEHPWYHPFDKRDPSSLDIASAWIQDCLSNHRMTCLDSRGTPLPSRVLAIGTHPQDIRLFEAKNNSMGQYACLSHCWGAQQILQTTRGNLEAHKKFIAWDDIPRTFQDAIKVAWSLDLEYLWIDSICIIQDDETDWIRESAKMCDIYENSHLTIAASSASNSTDGLYLSETRHLGISGITSAGWNFHLSVTKSNGVHPNPWNTNDEWPLLGRAWVFQERMLSPRVLHFSKDELLWECRDEIRCECGDARKFGKEAFFAKICQPTTENLIQLWHNLTETYCPLGLTFASDKLPALSGLASKIAKMKPQARYLAGLWSDSPTDLLWINAPRPKYLRQKAMANWRAPTWSWASTDAHIVYPLSDYHSGEPASGGQILDIFFTISDAWIELATSDPRGQVRSGSITISGHTFEAEFVVKSTGSDVKTESANTDDVFKDIGNSNYYKNFGLVISGTREFLQIENSFDDYVSFDFEADPFRNGGKISLDHRPIKVIRMARFRRGNTPSWNFGVNAEYGMVVQQSRSSASFERIGMIVLQRELPLKEYLQDSERMWKENPSVFEEGGVFETITIV